MLVFAILLLFANWFAHTGSFWGMFSDLPNKFRHSIPVTTAARLVQGLDVMGGLRLLALKRRLSACALNRDAMGELTLMFGSAGRHTEP